MDKGRITPAIALFAAMAAYVAGIGCLLGMRLRAEYRGESLGEAPSRVTARTTVRAAAVRHRNSRRHALNGPVAAILEKELLYLSRSGVMLFALLTPLIVLFGVGGRIRTEHTSEVGFLFPFAVAYAFLPMTRQVCNSLGAEGAGIQLYFLAPTAFRTVMLGKNLLQVAMFCVELVLVCLIVVSRYGMPRPLVLIATFGWLLFALPANLAAGNILSICLPYRMTLTRLSREQGSVGNGLLSLLIQLIVFAIGVALYAALVATGHSGFITPAFLILAVGGIWLWLRVLSNVDRLAARRREALIEAIVRTA
jgi:ABC-2 type transport system permease protein